MSRKDYVLIAAALQRARLTNTSGAHAIAINDAAICLAYSLLNDNPKFDKQKFLRAAGVEYYNVDKAAA